MFDLVPLLLFLIVVVVYAATQKNTNNLMYSLVGVTILMAICLFDMREKFTNYASTDYTMGGCDGQNVVDWRTRSPPYANLVIPSKKTNHKLMSDVTIFSPVGEGIKLTSDPVSGSFPTVDGKANSPRHLFMLSHNFSHPSCCPSTFSTSTGCVCTTNAQRELINSRGGNQGPFGNPDI